MVNSLSLGLFCKIQVNIEASVTKQCTNSVGLWHFFFYPHSLSPPNPNWRLYYVVFVVGAIYLVQNVLSLFPILHYLNTWNAKMLSASYRKRQRPPFIAYYYYFFAGGGRGMECPKKIADVESMYWKKDSSFVLTKVFTISAN